MNANRLAAMQRIRALMGKTVANGCTESEALAAAAKIGELMDRYGLTYSDFELKSERCEVHEATHSYHDVNLVAVAIARFCSRILRGAMLSTSTPSANLKGTLGPMAPMPTSTT